MTMDCVYRIRIRIRIRLKTMTMIWSRSLVEGCTPGQPILVQKTEKIRLNKDPDYKSHLALTKPPVISS